MQELISAECVKSNSTLEWLKSNLRATSLSVVSAEFKRAVLIKWVSVLVLQQGSNGAVVPVAGVPAQNATANSLSNTEERQRFRSQLRRQLDKISATPASPQPVLPPAPPRPDAKLQRGFLDGDFEFVSVAFFYFAYLRYQVIHNFCWLRDHKNFAWNLVHQNFSLGHYVILGENSHNQTLNYHCFSWLIALNFKKELPCNLDSKLFMQKYPGSHLTPKHQVFKEHLRWRCQAMDYPWLRSISTA